MAKAKLRTALGLMSGTSLDGIDAALIRSDGRARVETGAWLTQPYDPDTRAMLRAAALTTRDVEVAEAMMTHRHAAVVKALLAQAGVAPSDVDVIGFHGHTIRHAPERGHTWQIGDGALLAKETGIPVVCRMRYRDVAEGGQGAPLAPLYHAALAAKLDKPLAVLNLGGVGNVTWIGPGEDELLAFDTGPGNALIDDWVSTQLKVPFDKDGALAASGRVNEAALAVLMANPYFAVKPPKSLDRDAFDPAPVAKLSVADGAATLAAFTAAAVAEGRKFFSGQPKRWLVCGGGRHNAALMAALRARLGVPVDPVEAVGWNGDALEAQAFAYLALRSLDGLPLSLPGTTGVSRPMTGGDLHKPPARTDG